MTAWNKLVDGQRVIHAWVSAQFKSHLCPQVEKGYARKSKATRYAGGYLLGSSYTLYGILPRNASPERVEAGRQNVFTKIDKKLQVSRNFVALLQNKLFHIIKTIDK